MHSIQKNRRLHSFDLLRLILVLIALFNHFLITHGGSPEMPDASQSTLVVQEKVEVSEQTGGDKVLEAGLPELKNTVFNYLMAVTRSAMPVLLIIFGFMIEYVYARRWDSSGPKLILERMMGRAVICYLAFASIILLVFFLEGHTILTFFGNIFFIFDGHSHANLFKYYALLIPMAFTLMLVRFSFGWKWQLLFVGLLIGTAEWLKLNYPGFPGLFDHLSKFFIGLGNKLGPSMIHSLVLIVFGALAANSHLNRQLSFQSIVLLLLSVFSFVAITYEIFLLGLNEFVASIADYYVYRAKNSYVYFSYGIVTFLSFWALSYLLTLKLPEGLKEKISYYGGNTFIIFFYGNFIILLIPEIADNSLLKLFISGVALGLSMAAVNAFDWAEKHFAFIGHINQLIKLIVNKSINALAYISLKENSQRSYARLLNPLPKTKKKTLPK